ncbi:hypothetical protein SanaruYs_35650 [Chryseotalea sanaruensis]|uniref:Lipoprotein n=1 Tax=Chryseotalea sanaruensis TaxID=2482724 RepID=A0A401UEN2_9BACT|nr:hypothetical protein [Chryseotalea sanaruensis]GCC53322.1 hypothetical protein SanaruYs_35650 [Chryseotalea sanaruensis]
MIKRKVILFFVFFMTTCSSQAQINHSVLTLMKEDFKAISFHKLIFSEIELIEFCKASIGQNQFEKSLSNLKSIQERMTEGNAKEVTVVCNMIYKRVNDVKPYTEEQRKGKMFILDRLNEFQVNFKIDENFLLKRFDSAKRGITQGEDECSPGYSKYIFLIYDPILYKDVMIKNKSVSQDGVVYLPLLCTIEEDDGLMPIRAVMQRELLRLLSNYKDPAFDELKRRIKESELEETHD